MAPVDWNAVVGGGVVSGAVMRSARDAGRLTSSGGWRMVSRKNEISSKLQPRDSSLSSMSSFSVDTSLFCARSRRKVRSAVRE